jgi:hypothetical protein
MNTIDRFIANAATSEKLQNPQISRHRERNSRPSREGEKEGVDEEQR